MHKPKCANRQADTRRQVHTYMPTNTYTQGRHTETGKDREGEMKEDRRRQTQTHQHAGRRRLVPVIVVSVLVSLFSY